MDPDRAVYFGGVFPYAACLMLISLIGETCHSAGRTRVQLQSAVETRGGWYTDRHELWSTIDMPSTQVTGADLQVRAWLRERLFSVVARQLGFETSGSHFFLFDLFYVSYEPHKQAKLDLHCDGSLWSFNILLNSSGDFEGGGTCFGSSQTVLRAEQGDCIVHDGQYEHGGTEVRSGLRIVLVGFVKTITCSADTVASADTAHQLAAQVAKAEKEAEQVRTTEYIKRYRAYQEKRLQVEAWLATQSR